MARMVGEESEARMSMREVEMESSEIRVLLDSIAKEQAMSQELLSVFRRKLEPVLDQEENANVRALPEDDRDRLPARTMFSTLLRERYEEQQAVNRVIHRLIGDVIL